MVRRTNKNRIESTIVWAWNEKKVRRGNDCSILQSVSCKNWTAHQLSRILFLLNYLFSELVSYGLGSDFFLLSAGYLLGSEVDSHLSTARLS